MILKELRGSSTLTWSELSYSLFLSSLIELPENYAISKILFPVKPELPHLKSGKFIHLHLVCKLQSQLKDNDHFLNFKIFCLFYEIPLNFPVQLS